MCAARLPREHDQWQPPRGGNRSQGMEALLDFVTIELRWVSKIPDKPSRPQDRSVDAQDQLRVEN